MWCDVAVPHDAIRGNCGPAKHQSAAHVAETRVLGGVVRRAIRTLQLDADGEVVATDTIPETGFARVPGSVGKGDKLDEGGVASNQEMSGYPQIGDGAEALISLRIEPIAEELLDMGPAELTRRQADSVDHDQIDTAVGWPGIEVGRRHSAGVVEPVSRRIEVQLRAAPCSMRMNRPDTSEIPAAVTLSLPARSRSRGRLTGPARVVTV